MNTNYMKADLFKARFGVLLCIICATSFQTVTRNHVMGEARQKHTDGQQ